MVFLCAILSIQDFRPPAPDAFASLFTNVGPPPLEEDRSYVMGV